MSQEKDSAASDVGVFVSGLCRYEGSCVRDAATTGCSSRGGGGGGDAVDSALSHGLLSESADPKPIPINMKQESCRKKDFKHAEVSSKCIRDY